MFFAGKCFSQTYSNGWIDVNKTYYKFLVAKDGIYHINQSTLQAIGLDNIPAEQFQLWRNGQQVMIYTSIASGVFPSGGYIEFFGMMNDGKTDTKMYLLPDYQLSDRYSVVTDTAAYFLTVNPNGNNLRFSDDVNDVASNNLAPEPFFMNTKGNYFRDRINPGRADVAQGSYLYSSSYDMGEGWSSGDIYPGQSFQAGFSNLNLYRNGPPATLSYAASGNALNDRSIRVKIFNTVVDESRMPLFTYVKKTINALPLTLFLDLSNLQISIENTSPEVTDRLSVAKVEITYPSVFNFNNEKDFYFELPASSSGNFLVIDNFNSGNQAPVLLDLSAGKRYMGDITSTPGKVKFALPPSSIEKRKFRLMSVSADAVNQVTSLQKKTFVNFSQSANQGNYLIISNKLLFSSTNGTNNVEQYRLYRNSAAGGSFNAKVIDIDDLTDEFAYGIKKHPAAIKDFVQYAKDKFSTLPQYIFLMGKGVTYDEYRKNKNSQYADKLNLVPTFGQPASDVLLASPYGSIVPTVAIGRLSAVSGDEVGIYLSKMKEYELAQNSTVQTLANKLWMKNVADIIGGKEAWEKDLFNYYMDHYKNLLEGPFFGAHVETFSKSSNSSVQLIAGKRLEQLFSDGLSVINYFGHSSANLLEFNLSDPSAYNNAGKYPMFIVSGCTAGNNYFFDTLRIIQSQRTISENFVLSKGKGSIGFMASTHFGIPNFLDDYDSQLFEQISRGNYGNSFGNEMKITIQNLGGANQNSLSLLPRMHLEEIALHGDPALKVNSHPKPDYVIEESQIKIDPSFVSVADKDFVLNAKAFNIGKAIDDSITFQIKRTYPDGTTEVVLNKRIKAIYYADSVRIVLPIISTRDKGLNKITVTIDSDNEVSEISESNNSFTKEIFIYEDEATPVFPYDFAIVNVQNQKVVASTANPLSAEKDYVMEMDTTALFNSSFKITRTLHQKGGILEFDPGFSYADSTVYYWRVAPKPASGLPADYHWNQASFIYLANSSSGSNQSHYFQHLKSDTVDIILDSSRKWKYSTLQNEIVATNGVFPTAAVMASQFKVMINGSDLTASVCGISGIIFNVLDPVSLKPWVNSKTAPRFGSDPVCGDDRINNFQFNILDKNKRKAAIAFLDSVPDNFIVVVRNISGTEYASNTYAADWQADTTDFGSGNSLYNRLRSQGFALIDSFNRPRSFIFMYQKNNTEMPPAFTFSEGILDRISLTEHFTTPDTLGYITSPKFGPAKSWKEIHWRGKSMEANSPDNPTVQILGVDNAGNISSLFILNKNQQDFDISSISANQFPYLQLKMRNVDSVTVTPYQLDYWRLNFQPVPEGALAPNLFFTSKDTLQLGETLHFGIAFKNISLEAFDSLKVKISIIDNKNVTHILSVAKQKPLLKGDSLTIKFDIDTKDYPGANTLFIDFNPDNDQPEQFHFNNFLYHNFYVGSDNVNPLLDVTFDGVHILNRDIVSAKPHILIKLKDESKFLALNDTALLKVQLLFPDGTLKNYRFDNDTVRFIPANLANGDNTATIDFNPTLVGDDEEYQLIVSGKDASGNKAGAIDYHINFRVISKAMISNMMNYPNPFTTSTAFVFTVTGSVVPQNIRIQILTVTGKVVREITKEELGPLHIGRNITEFKWDGTDMFGQKLANGVYLYRVLTNLNGNSLERFKDKNDNTDQFFTKGYGKMYLMR